MVAVAANACGTRGGGARPATAPDAAFCGNGVVEAGETCDDGNLRDDDGCTVDCTPSCEPGDERCDDGNPCNGVESCGADHRCQPGTPLPRGTACGAGRICTADGACGAALCGDGFVTAPEECDDGNEQAGDGCEGCLYGCIPGDPLRDCAPTGPCEIAGACDPATHTCGGRIAAQDGTACGVGRVCVAGGCVEGRCGDGYLTEGEQCDFGVANAPGSGCEPDCRFSCTSAPDSCLEADPCTGIGSCQSVLFAGHHGQACAAGSPLADGVSCGVGRLCRGGVCVEGVCGDGFVTAGEECDFGSGNGPNVGCEADCRFSCTLSPDRCSDGNPCNGSESCQRVQVGGKAGQACVRGTALANCQACGAGAVCRAGACSASACGDSCLDSASGEQCEPPDSASCDAACHRRPVCGDGLRETGEQCDDGGRVNLDGCDSNCRFEQNQRFTRFMMQFSTGTFCPQNALGGAIGTLARATFQSFLDDGVRNGELSIVLAFLGLDDLTGFSDPALSLGAITASPYAPGAGGSYDGSADLDWWYQPSASSVDSWRVPLKQLAGSLAAGVLAAGPGSITLSLSLGSGPQPMSLSGARIRASTGPTSAPLASTGSPPGHLAALRLDPAVRSFGSMSNGELCGNVSASSLARIPVPTDLLAGGGFPCNQGYTASNSMLDVFVGGCTMILFNVVAATQPDQDDASVASLGAGPPYRLSAGAGRVVNGCRDRTGAVVDLDSCLQDAAYSSYFRFASDRVIVK